MIDLSGLTRLAWVVVVGALLVVGAIVALVVLL